MDYDFYHDTFVTIIRSASDYFSHPEHRRGLMNQSVAVAEVQTIDQGEEGLLSQPAVIITENNPEPQYDGKEI